MQLPNALFLVQISLRNITMRHDSRLWPGSGREGYGDQQTPDARRGRSRDTIIRVL
jgi:hypothetical protein